MSNKVRWGIAGPGRIAAKVAADFGHVDNGELVAVGSRSLQRARAFADEHAIPRAHGSYRALIDDPGVDAIYVATPHPQHRDIALAAIEAGKHLVIEKAFTATAAGTEQIIAAARAQGVFVMEAMWTRFQPAILAAKRVIADGAIGEVRAVQADLVAFREYDPSDRLFAPELGGGAMLDLGVYPISFAQHFLGEATEILARGTTYPNGMDAAASMILTYPDGRSASLFGAMDCAGPGRAAILGTKGWIDVPPRLHHPDRIIVHAGDQTEEIQAPATGTGYCHEFVAAGADILAGRTENELLPLSGTLALQRLLDSACGQLGVRHAEDDGVELD